MPLELSSYFCVKDGPFNPSKPMSPHGLIGTNVQVKAYWLLDAFRIKKNSQIIAKFSNEEDKKAMYKARIGLKNKKPVIFINEDLIPSRAELAAEARKLVKDKKISGTWSLDGQVFVKLIGKDKPVKIQGLRDLVDIQSTSKDEGMKITETRGGLNLETSTEQDPLDFTKTD